MISYHFAGKDELLEQVVETVYTKAVADMAPQIKAERSPEAALATYLRSNLEFIRDHPSDIAALTEIAEFDTRTMAWAIRTLIDGVNRQRNQDPEFDFDTCVTETVALIERATRKTGP